MASTQGSRVKEVRKHFRLSQKELADKINVDQSAISLIENKGTASTDVLYKISQELNVNMSWLISGEGEMKTKEEKPEPKNEGAVFLSAAVLYEMWQDEKKTHREERGNMIKVMLSLSDQLKEKEILLQSLLNEASNKEKSKEKAKA